jgi:spore germination protein YaaH
LEHVQIADGPALTDFFRQAAHALHQHGLKITMAVPKRMSSAPAPAVPAPGSSGHIRGNYEDWRGAFDFKKLAEISDFLSFMAYGQNKPSTPPGPVAGIPMMKKEANYLLGLGIDPRKISFGLPIYSFHWYPSARGATAERLSYRRVQNLLDRYHLKRRWMAGPDVYYAWWPQGLGEFNWLFIEGARSFKRKLKFVRTFHFRGFSAWVMGSEDPGIWKVLKQQTRPRHYLFHDQPKLGAIK